MTNTITANLDAEIAKAKKQAAARIAKLKREAAAEQKKVDAKVIELLRQQDPALHEVLSRLAVEALAAARTKSSKDVGRAASTGSSAPAGNFDEPRTFEAGA